MVRTKLNIDDCWIVVENISVHIINNIDNVIVDLHPLGCENSSEMNSISESFQAAAFEREEAGLPSYPEKISIEKSNYPEEINTEESSYPTLKRKN